MFFPDEEYQIYLEEISILVNDYEKFIARYRKVNNIRIEN